MNNEDYQEYYASSAEEIELKRLKDLIADLLNNPANEEIYKKVRAAITSPTPVRRKIFVYDVAEDSARINEYIKNNKTSWSRKDDLDFMKSAWNDYKVDKNKIIK